MLSTYFPILVIIVIGCGLGLTLLAVAKILGPRRPNPIKNIPYESGLDPASAPRIRFNAKFYRVALLFLVFDIEAAFFYPWAVMFRDLSCKGQMNGRICVGGATPFGLLVMLAFLAILILALIFVWRKKALEWE